MKFMKFLVVAGLAATTALAAEPTQVQNDAFTMTLPTGFGAFAKQAQTVNSPDGKIDTTTWISKSPTGEAVVVSMSKMPGKILDADKMFASTRDALLKSTNSTIDKEEKIAGSSNPSERLWFHSASGAFLRSRLIVSNDRLYNVLYVGHSEDQRNNPAVGSMFDTFTVAAPQPVAQTTTAPPATMTAPPAATTTTAH